MKSLFRITLALCLAGVFVLGTVGSSNALPATPPGLVLWNKLGNQTEVLNSEVGVGFAISSEPEVKFFPGVYGGAFGTEGGIWGYGGYLYMSPDDFFAPDKTRGTVEMWLQKRIPSLIPFQTPLVGIFGLQNYNCVPWVNPCDRDDYAPISAYWSDGYTGSGGLTFEIVDTGGNWHTAQDTGWNDPNMAPMYEWKHVAFVWDLNGIAGTADKLRIYRDGVVVGSNTDTIADIMFDDGVVKLLGHHEYRRYNQPTAYMDNLKVWDYAKTDFSDRSREGFNQPPVAEAGGPYIVAEGGSAMLDGTASNDPDVGNTLTFAWDLDGDGVFETPGETSTFAGLDGPASHPVTLQVCDPDAACNTDATTVDVTNVAPTAQAGADVTTYRNAPVSLAGTWTDPAASLDDPYAWTWDLAGDGTADASGSAAYGETATAAAAFATEGVYNLTFAVTDADGASGQDSVRITVLNHAPDCSAAAASPALLWPPNNKFVPISIGGVTDAEADPLTLVITAIRQDEPVGKGNSAPDGKGVGAAVAELRAEKFGGGDGRVYHVSFTASDGHGGVCTGQVRVAVPHDQARPAVDGGPLYDSTVPTP